MSRKKPKNKCHTRFCRNDKAPGKNYCHKCRSRRTKELNPIQYYYNALRSNARRRGKEFVLTRAEFEKFCAETNYLELKGRQWNKMTIDRKDHTRGYSYDNIEIMGHSENSIKGNNEKNNVPF